MDIPDYLTVITKGQGSRGGKLVLGASLLAVSMRPGEATNTQVVVSKVYLPNLVSLYVVGKTTYLNLK